MLSFLPTIILRHRKENRKKCSLRGLESRNDLHFFTYPKDNLPQLRQYILLTLDAPTLTQDDRLKGIFIIDGTWKYAARMEKFVLENASVTRRSLPSGCKTAYPRKQTDCIDPQSGLASIEALFIAFCVLDRADFSLLDNYYWKETFLCKNWGYLASFNVNKSESW